MSPLRDLTQSPWDRLSRRVLIAGSPNMGKTTSLLTWPRPLAVVVCPGELGLTSIPAAPDVDVYTQDVDWSKDISWQTVVDTFKKDMATALTDSRYQTVACDGLHKAHWAYLNMVNGGAPARGEKLDARKAYPPANAKFFGDLRAWLMATTPNLVFTVWIGRDKQDPDNPESKSVIFPALPGQAGELVVGEFAVCLHAEREGTGPAARYIWRTQPNPSVFGVGIKAPPDVAKRIPATVVQDWTKLAAVLTT